MAKHAKEYSLLKDTEKMTDTEIWEIIRKSSMYTKAYGMDKR